MQTTLGGSVGSMGRSAISTRRLRLCGQLERSRRLGVYSTDADVVNPASLTWQAATYLNQEQVGDDNSDNETGAGPSAHVSDQPTPTQPKLPVLPTVRPAAPYRVTGLPAVRAATLNYDMMHSGFDGISIDR
jgi:hypothetical protein